MVQMERFQAKLFLHLHSTIIAQLQYVSTGCHICIECCVLVRSLAQSKLRREQQQHKQTRLFTAQNFAWKWTKWPCKVGNVDRKVCTISRIPDHWWHSALTKSTRQAKSSNTPTQKQNLFVVSEFSSKSTRGETKLFGLSKPLWTAVMPEATSIHEMSHVMEYRWTAY